MIGINEERSYRELKFYAVYTQKSVTIFRFATTLCKNKGNLTLRFPFPDGLLIYFDAEIINTRLPLRLRLDVLHAHGLIIDVSKGFVASSNYACQVPFYYH